MRLQVLYSPSQVIARLSNLALRALGRDLTNAGERVDITYKGRVDVAKLDMYQKSHYARYQFARKLLKDDMLVADMACGTGYGTVMMSEVAQHAYGCDISPVIETIKQRYADVPRVTFHHSDILKVTGIPQLDAIVSFETVEHLPESSLGDLFRRFNMMLGDNGLLIFSVPFMQESTPASRKHHRVFDIDETRANGWLREAGFEVQTYYYQNYVTHEIAATVENPDFMICVCRKLISVSTQN